MLVSIKRVKLTPIKKPKCGVSNKVRSAHKQRRIQEHENVLIMNELSRVVKSTNNTNLSVFLISFSMHYNILYRLILTVISIIIRS